MTDQSSKRRAFLQSLGGLGVAGLAGCVSESPASSDSDRSPFQDDADADQTESEVRSRPTPSGPADETFQLRAAESIVQPGPDAQTQNWVYDGEFPGPELRVAEGDVLRAEVTNELPEGTTIHWHGVPVPNSEDGVPNVTQQPILPGETYSYKYRAEPAGTYLYHSHVGLQLDRGLGGPLVIEEQSPHVEYDREYVVLLDDYLDGEPQLPSGFGRGGGGGSGGHGPGGGGGGQGPGGGGGGHGPGGGGDGGMGDGMGDGGGRGPGGGMGQMADHRPPYEGLLVNGRLPADPPTFDVKRGERVRFRFINASSATNFRVQLAGHRFSVSHADGRPVEPVTVDSFAFGSGERYDAVVTADNPGAWELRADAVDGDEPAARAVFAYEKSGGGSEDQTRSPTAVSSGGRHLQYGDLRALNPIQGIGGQSDRTFDLTLSRGMGGGYEWYIDGQVYPGADPLRVSEGDHVRVRMVNRSPVVHPMHLHGHFFQVGDAVKDTVRVPPRMGEVTFDFVADNPGDWLFHCHNLYHLEAGMARVFTYE